MSEDRPLLPPDVFERVRQDAFGRPEPLLGEMAVERGWLTEDQLQRCLKEQARPGAPTVPLGVLLLEGSYITAEQLGELTRLQARSEESAEPRTVGRFRILKRLGIGGMAEVFLAEDPYLRRQVALKMLMPTLGLEATERFAREAVAAARLRHPGIVAVHEIGVYAGRYYLAMDYVDGGTFANMLSVLPPVSREKKLELLRDVALAVAEAHAHGVIHRDLKPANILMDRSGRPIVADFGVARLEGVTEGLTTTGSLLGTPHYMSPEQAAGGKVDARTDVYSLGVILYEILTGSLPFRNAESFAALLRQIAEREPLRPRFANRDVPADLETICLRAMEKAPARRYAGAAELAEDLRRFLAGEPILARPPSAIRRIARRLERHWKLAAVIAAGLATAAIVLATRPSERASRERLEAVEELHRAGNRIDAAMRTFLYQDSDASAEELHRRVGEKEATLERLAPRVGDHPDLHLYRARAREARGDFAGAMRHYDEGVRLHPRHVDLLRGRCRLTLELTNVVT